MRKLSLPLAAILLLAATAEAATYREIELGDQVAGTITAGEVVVIPFRGTAGTLVKLTLKGETGSFPDLSILRPSALARTPVDLLDKKKLDTKKGKSARVQKLALPATGVHYLLLTAKSTTDFNLKTAGKPLKKLTVTPIIPLTAPDLRILGSMPGTLLSVSAKAGKGSPLDPEIVEIRSHPGGVPYDHDDLPPGYDPEGDPVDFSAAKQKVKTGRHSVSKVPLPDFGDVSVRIGARAGSPGGPATVKFKLKHPPPRKAKILLTEILVDPQVDQVLPGRAFDNNGGPGLSETTLAISGAFFRPDATLRLTNTLGETIRAAGLTRLDHTSLQAVFDFRTVPESVARGEFDVVVEQRRGDPGKEESGRLAKGFVLDRAPVATTISPTVTWDGPLYGFTPFTITGMYFKAPVTVTFVKPVPGGEPTVSSVVVTPTTLTFPVNSWNSTPDTYRITVTNGDGGKTELPVTLEVRVAPQADAVDQGSVFDNAVLTGVKLTGGDFAATPEITFVHQADGDVIEATSEVAVSSTEVTFDVRGIGEKLGLYDLFVTNPDGGRDLLRSALTVRRAPAVTGVNPVRGFEGETLDPFTISGDYFEAGTTVALTHGGDTLAPDDLLFRSAALLSGTLDLSGAAHGAWGVTVTNPSDGGTDSLPGALHVLGTFGLVEDETGASTPLAVRDGVRDEYFVVYLLEKTGGDHDVRAQRISADTGEVVAEVKVTETASVDESDPALAYDPDGDRFIVVYVTGGKTLRLAEIPGGAASVKTTLTLTSGSKALGHSSVAVNGDDGEFLVLTEAGTDLLAIRVPTAGGLSGSSLETFTPLYDSESPAVIWDSVNDVYVIVYAQDADESQFDPAPPDTGLDLIAALLESGATSIDSRDVSTVTMTTDDEVRPRLVPSPDESEILIVWERVVSASNTDIYARRFDASGTGSFPAAAVHVEDESAATVDATHPSVIWEADANQFLFVYLAGGNDVLLTTATSTLASLTYTTLVAGATGDTRSTPAVAAREKDGEILVLYGIDASAVPDRRIEGRFSR